MVSEDLKTLTDILLNPGWLIGILDPYFHSLMKIIPTKLGSDISSPKNSPNIPGVLKTLLRLVAVDGLRNRTLMELEADGQSMIPNLY